MITKISLMFRLLKIVHVRYVDENCDRCKYFDDGSDLGSVDVESTFNLSLMMLVII